MTLILQLIAIALLITGAVMGLLLHLTLDMIGPKRQEAIAHMQRSTSVIEALFVSHDLTDDREHALRLKALKNATPPRGTIRSMARSFTLSIILCVTPLILGTGILIGTLV